MSTVLLIVFIMVGLFFTNIYGVLRGGQKKLAWFYCICYGISFVVLVLNSVDIFVYGPSHLARDLIKALGFI